MKRVVSESLALWLLLMAISGCRASPPAAQVSPDGRWTLTASFHEGSLVRITVRERAAGQVVDEVGTRESNAMKWIAGWVDDTGYVFWGSDSGASWQRRFDGQIWGAAPLDAAACAALERLFKARYGETRGHCLR